MSDLNSKIILTHEQSSVVKQTDGRICVAAVPGSGKSTVIEKRIEYLINQKIPEKNIYAVTFTNRAAMNLKKEIQKLLRHEPESFVGTFHSLCRRILWEYDKGFHFFSEPLQEKFILEISQEYFNHKPTNSEIQHLLHAIQLTKQNCSYDLQNSYARFFFLPNVQKQFEQYIWEGNDEEQFYYLYLQKQCQMKILDYEDLLQIVLYLLHSYPVFCKSQQQKCQYILCDEYQDVNEKQNELMRILSEVHGNLTVVGDDDQNIYSWRGADFRFIRNFWANSLQMQLTVNFRSKQEIIDVADSIIEKNTNRIQNNTANKMTGYSSDLHSNTKPILILHATAQQEAQWIASQIKTESPTESAILVRSRSQIPLIEHALKEQNISYELPEKTDTQTRLQLNLFLSYLRMVGMEEISNDDFELTVNYPPRNFNHVQIRKLKMDCPEGTSLFSFLCDQLDNERRKTGSVKNKDLELYTTSIRQLRASYQNNQYNCLDVVDKLCELFFHNDSDNTDTEHSAKQVKWGSFESILKVFLRKNIVIVSGKSSHATYDKKKQKYIIDQAFQWIDLEEIIENYEEFTGQNEKVKILTIHAAKGDEYHTVFIPGMVEGIFPSHASKLMNPEEERRLFYVAVTRAKEKLYLSTFKTSNNKSDQKPSVLLADISPNLLDIKRNFD